MKIFKEKSHFKVKCLLITICRLWLFVVRTQINSLKRAFICLAESRTKCLIHFIVTLRKMTILDPSMFDTVVQKPFCRRSLSHQCSRGDHGQDQDWISCKIVAIFSNQDRIWIFIFEKHWIRTESGYWFDFYNEIFLRVIQDVTNDGGSVFFAMFFILSVEYVPHSSQ